MSAMEEDMTIPHAIFMNRNLVAILIDCLVEEGVISPETRDRIIREAVESLTPQPGEVKLTSTEDFIRDVFAKGREMGYTKAAPAAPVCPSCGAEADPAQRFCASCGAKMR
ncbi:hypothetical protein A3K81_03075 [Candidatus Bathyarchaeota archaeon RBG_13_60_20]|nr:MAG: hypothetical protein A3K81_03075 [Candidatus Bathyarchaeota archaeon RBG_13_60_20]